MWHLLDDNISSTVRRVKLYSYKFQAGVKLVANSLQMLPSVYPPSARTDINQMPTFILEYLRPADNITHALLSGNAPRSLTLLERTCCDGNTFNASSVALTCDVGADEPNEPVLGNLVVMGLAAAGVVAMLICSVVCYCRRKKPKRAAQTNFNFPVAPRSTR